jgi:hypothetical protein
VTRALDLSIELGDGECPVAFASRLACRNGWDLVEEFCAAMGLVFRGLQEGDATELSRLARLASIAPRMMCQSAFVRSGRYYLFQGQRLAVDDLECSPARFCGACLLQDLTDHAVQMAARPFRRSVWLLSGIYTCPAHHLRLIKLRRGYGIHPMDFSATIRPHIRELESLTAASARCVPTQLEAYFLNRLAGESGMAPWLDAMPFDVASQVCGILGALATYAGGAVLDDASVTRDRGVASLGFTFAVGDAHKRQELLCSHSPKEQDGPKRWRGRGAFGALYDWVYHLGDNEDYVPLRDMLRQSASTTMGIANGQNIFAHDFRIADLHRGARLKPPPSQ